MRRDLDFTKISGFLRSGLFGRKLLSNGLTPPTALVFSLRVGVAKARASLQLKLVERFIVLVALVQIFLLGQVIILVHYFGLDAVASFSFVAADEWCEANSGLGVHCFGDYSFLRNAIVSGNPWDPPWSSTYPASSLFPVALVVAFESATGSFSAGLAAYLVALFVAVSAPWVVLIFRNTGLSLSTKALALFVFGPLSLPALIVLDRGNTVGFVVPALVLVLLGLAAGNSRIAALGIVLAVLVKPQFILMAFLLVKMKKWALLLGSLLTISVVEIGAFLAFGPSQLASNIAQAIGSAGNYNSGSFSWTAFPTNVSITGALQNLMASMGLSNTSLDLNVISIGLFSLLFLALVIRSAALSSYSWAIVLIGFSAFGPSTTWAYYLIIAPVTFSLLALEAKTAVLSRQPKSHSRVALLRSRIVTFIALLAHLLSLSTVLLPVPTAGDRTALPLFVITPLVWLALAALLTFSPRKE